MAHSRLGGRRSERWPALSLTGGFKATLNLIVFIHENQNNGSSLTREVIRMKEYKNLVKYIINNRRSRQMRDVT